MNVLLLESIVLIQVSLFISGIGSVGIKMASDKVTELFYNLGNQRHTETNILSTAQQIKNETTTFTRDVQRCSLDFLPLGISAMDLTYFMYTPEAIDDATAMKYDTIGVLDGTEFCPLRNTVFVIHGWLNNHNSPMNTVIRKAMLTNHDVNLFVVDWSPIAMNNNYLVARNAVRKVGKFLALFVKSLVEKFDLRVSDVTFVGHSLGAHVAGNAGADLNGNVDQIVGLDPAGICFIEVNTLDRLDPSDARFVAVIHSDAKIIKGLGFRSALGHVDYYPNGENIQPGCGLDLTSGCSHGRSYYYYAESLSGRKFLATKCPEFDNFENNECTRNPKSFMGGYPVDKNARGTYYLYTNSESPYAKDG